ncbi:MAG: sulfatase-like hydrolase/transferase [Thermoguttaceae bacterium]|jgi:arylsulfatase A
MFRTTAVLLASILAVAAIARAADSPAAASRPNIILILADDVGLGDVHCSGGPFHTPHIDKLATGGLRFENCYATPLCGPSRCELLTGRYPFRTGLISNQSRNAVDPSREAMIPTVLKKAGYMTASVGKWGQICLGPGEWGFDEYLVFPGSGRYWRRQTTYYTVNGKQQDLPAGHYLPDIMHQFLVDFIARHKDRPFFIYYPMSHIHEPIVRTPDSTPGASKEQRYAANIEYMDKLVGQLVAELDRQHLREKTLLLFTGDNGTAKFGSKLATVDGHQISGLKGAMLEGGSRVPLLVNWPGVTPAGKVSRDLTDFSDFFATIAEVAGAKLPEGVVLDSHSFLPQIRGEKGSPRKWVYVELRGESYVRGPRFKLTNGGDLFDMAQAPFQEIPVAKESADAAAVAARQQLQAVLDRHQAAPWTPRR